STDHMKIKPGLFHKANGGYLILQAEEMLGNYEAWNVIKQVLKTRKTSIENPEGISVTTIATLRPEPIDIDVKVILIGSTQIYQLLYNNDFEFKRIFRVRADFDKEMHHNQNNTRLIARFIKTHCNQQSLLPFSTTAVSTVLRYASRYVENQKKITAEFGWISNIMVEAHTFASLQGAKMVDEEHVHLAVEEKRYRASRVEDKIDEQMMNHTIMIETNGSQVGQINALAIYDDGEYRFGKPLKVTATTYQGKSGIINIEKEAKLSGDIHTKGIQVITGYLGQNYAQEFPLSLSCRICFEQNYGQIDGDSASSAELYTILSSLADIGLKQNIAVTGSVNQHGMIQPVGGVTHKTEGFFKVCKKRGLTGNQGVIIPIQNISDLVLNDEVIKAVQENKFHIYAISSIQEGLEVLCGIPYQEIREKVKNKLGNFHATNLK
ncbi:MAG TPA: AAA family ATPase, partial [Epulopiscium sp.]|nr:AAA family ATPase [Candidatus Epulonipiscium sp.]